MLTVRNRIRQMTQATNFMQRRMQAPLIALVAHSRLRAWALLVCGIFLFAPVMACEGPGGIIASPGEPPTDSQGANNALNASPHHFSHISLYLANWNIASVSPPALQGQVMHFLSDRFDIMSGGVLDPKKWNKNTIWALYVDHAVDYVPDWPGCKQRVASLGFSDPEKLAMHSFLDYPVPGSLGWRYLDGFDAFDQPGAQGAGSYTWFRNGVLLLDGSNHYTDKSVAAYDRNLADVEIAHAILIGYSERFDEINFLLAQPASGCSVQWTYWNGSTYAALTPSSDGTAGLTQSGRIRFVPPSSWQPKPENNSGAKYWVKGTINDMGCKKHPVASRIWGASWTRVALENGRVLGSDLPFGTLNIEIARPASGITLSWEYWNGGWQPLAIASDSTNGLRQSGSIKFQPPRDWAKSSPPKADPGQYYVRAVVTGNGTTAIASAAQDELGWDLSTDADINLGWRNSGGQATGDYNPNPPAGASARWRYQSRVSGAWAHNIIFGNKSYVENGKRAWGEIILHRIREPQSVKGDYEAVLFDDGGNEGPLPQAQLDVPQDKTLLQYDYDTYDYELAQMKLVDPGFVFGANAVYDFSIHGDWVGNENAYFSYIGPPRYSFQTGGYWTFDGYLPGPHNPRNTKAYGMCMDTAAQLTPGTWTKTLWVPLDQANQTPIMCLAQYYIGANANTGFSYNPDGYYYADSDDYYYYSAPVSLAADLPAGSGERTITVAKIPADFARGIVRIGESIRTSGDKIFVTVNNHALVTSAKTFNSYPAGTNVYFVLRGHQSTDKLPDLSRIYRWGFWFPAMGVDVGMPSGPRNEHWLTGPQISGQQEAASLCVGSPYKCPAILRRDYTNAVILARPNMGVANGMLEQELVTPSKAFCIGDGSSPPCPQHPVYYPLKADGHTGPPVTFLQLRAAESAILMKQAVQ